MPSLITASVTALFGAVSNTPNGVTENITAGDSATMLEALLRELNRNVYLHRAYIYKAMGNFRNHYAVSQCILIQHIRWKLPGFVDVFSFLPVIMH